MIIHNAPLGFIYPGLGRKSGLHGSSSPVSPYALHELEAQGSRTLKLLNVGGRVGIVFSHPYMFKNELLSLTKLIFVALAGPVKNANDK